MTPRVVGHGPPPSTHDSLTGKCRVFAELFQVEVTKVGLGEVRTRHVRALERGAREYRVREDGALQAGALEVDAIHHTIREVRLVEVSVGEVTLRQLGVFEISRAAACVGYWCRLMAVWFAVRLLGCEGTVRLRSFASYLKSASAAIIPDRSNPTRWCGVVRLASCCGTFFFTAF